MEYNEHLVKHIDRFQKSVERRRLPGDMAQKLLSVLHCLEYQVEEGQCPKSVVRSLQSAMLSWIEAAGNAADLATELDHCIASIIEDMCH